jgi:predicted amidohydrolase
MRDDDTMLDPLNVTLVQACLQWRDPERNRAQLEQMMRAAGTSGLFVLPETFTTGFLGDTDGTAETMEGPTVAWMLGLAAELDAAVCGSAVIRDGAGLRNRFLLATPSGAVHHYDKRHLFSYAGEDKRFTAGLERVVFEYRGWRICPQICYDLRFPVWCRSRGDYDLLLFVANWPSPRVAAWDALLRARAIENQCWVVAVNRVGEDGNGVSYPGHSAIYDPMGDAAIAPWAGEGCRGADLSLEQVRAVRKRFPFADEADGFEIFEQSRRA